MVPALALLGTALSLLQEPRPAVEFPPACLEGIRRGEPVLVVGAEATPSLELLGAGFAVERAPAEDPDGDGDDELIYGAVGEVLVAVHREGPGSPRVGLVAEHDGFQWRLLGVAIEESVGGATLDLARIDAGRVALVGSHPDLRLRYALAVQAGTESHTGGFDLSRDLLPSNWRAFHHDCRESERSWALLQAIGEVVRTLLTDGELRPSAPIWAPEVLRGGTGLLVADSGWLISSFLLPRHGVLAHYPEPAPAVRWIDPGRLRSDAWYSPLDPDRAPPSLVDPMGGWRVDGRTRHRHLGDGAYRVRLPGYRDGYESRWVEVIVQRTEDGKFRPELLCFRVAQDFPTLSVGRDAECDFLEVETNQGGVSIRVRVTSGFGGGDPVELAFEGSFEPSSPDTLEVERDRVRGDHDPSTSGPWIPILLGPEHAWSALQARRESEEGQ